MARIGECLPASCSVPPVEALGVLIENDINAAALGLRDGAVPVSEIDADDTHGGVLVTTHA